MGLDSVEMIITVEDRFGTHIPDAQAVHILTVGDLYNAVLRLRNSATKLTCKTQHVFYRFRASLPHHLKGRCHPDCPLEEFIPEKGRRRYYEELSEAAGVQFPRLLTPAWFPDVEGIIVVGSLIMSFILYFCGFVFAASLVLVLFMPFLFAYLKLRYTYSTLLPRETVRGFIESTTALNFVDILPAFDNDAEVLQELKNLIVEKIGVDESEVVMSARFQQDLGAD